MSPLARSSVRFHLTDRGGELSFERVEVDDTLPEPTRLAISESLLHQTLREIDCSALRRLSTPQTRNAVENLIESIDECRRLFRKIG